MTPDPLNFLVELREAAGLTQKEVARRFDLADRQGYKSVAAWEKGESIPKGRLRARFLRYLWDDLHLHKEPTRFADCWDRLVARWHWEPLNDAERANLRLPLSKQTQTNALGAPPTQITMNGTFTDGNVTTGGGDVMGGDKIVHHYGFNADEVAQIIEVVQRSAPAQAAATTPAVRIRKPFEPECVLIPAGTFWLDCDDGPADQRPCHAVTLPAYAISQQPVTNAQYATFVQAATDHRPRGGGWRFTIPPTDKVNEPVCAVSWHSAVAYCAWLTAQSGQPYRLPTEAEWEQAAQLGIINGELREWTSTIWGDDASVAIFTYPYCTDGRDNLTASGVYRIWRRASSQAATAGRGFASPTSRLADLGLRVVLAAAV